MQHFRNIPRASGQLGARGVFGSHPALVWGENFSERHPYSSVAEVESGWTFPHLVHENLYEKFALLNCKGAPGSFREPLENWRMRLGCGGRI